jgi:hypothetical protein
VNSYIARSRHEEAAVEQPTARPVQVTHASLVPPPRPDQLRRAA